MEKQLPLVLLQNAKFAIIFYRFSSSSMATSQSDLPGTNADYTFSAADARHAEEKMEV
jgi:hypothetical protein